MKTLGLLGGMSWESTVPYYRLINQTVAQERGGLHSARLLLYSVDFGELAELQHAGDWDGAGRLLADAARALKAGGAELLVICTNTMHVAADRVVEASGLPLLHVVDATAVAIHAAGVQRVALLGTRFTMEMPFYRERLIQAGIDVLVPEAAQRADIHRVIYDELCRGEIRADSRALFAQIIAQLVSEGAQGVILGCTEIGLLLGPDDAAVPLFDTTVLHARAAALAALAD